MSYRAGIENDIFVFQKVFNIEVALKRRLKRALRDVNKIEAVTHLPGTPADLENFVGTASTSAFEPRSVKYELPLVLLL